MRKVATVLLVGLPMFALALFGSTQGAFFANVASAGYGGNDKVTICHKGKKTLSVGGKAAAKHMEKHGDTAGPCPAN